jgi:molybdopterin molybdotransferase
MLSFLSARPSKWFIRRVQYSQLSGGPAKEWPLAAGLISIDEASSRVLAEAFPLPAESCPLVESLGLVLAEDLVAPHDLPPFDNSAMDGFAVCSCEVADARQGQGVLLDVVHTVAAGETAIGSVRPGEAARIMTGAPLPPGTDAVIEFERTEETAGGVTVFESVEPSRNVRYAGEDVKAGTVALAAGTPLGPAEIGMIAALGIPTVQVHKRPRVAIVSTGSELVELGLPLGPGQIHNSNSYALVALCLQSGIESEVLGIAVDDRTATRDLLAKGLQHDVLLTTGGVSAGAFDFIKEVQAELGVERRLWGIAMKPGKPLVFGVRGRTLVFGLPGNPASAMVSFELFVRPALLRLMGHRQITRPLYRAMAQEDMKGSDERVHVVRVRAWRDAGVWRASSTGDQGSARLRSMVGANGLVFVPVGPAGVRAGEEVDLLLLREELEEP